MTIAETPKVQWQRRQIVGLLLLAVALAALLVGGIAYQHGAFSNHARIYFIADDVTGLSPGTTVRMSGIRIGKVLELDMQPDLTVKVTLAVDAEPYAHLRSDARANLVREQLRPAAIDLRAGSASAPLPVADPRVAFGRRGTLTEIAEDLRGRLAPILDDVKQLTAVTVQRKGDIESVLRNAQALTLSLAGTAEQLQALSTDLRQRVAGLGGQSATALAEANRALLRVGAVVGQAEKSLDAVNAKLPGMLAKADGMLGKTEGLLTQLDGVLRDSRTISSAAASGLPALMRSAPPLVDESREMMQGLRQAWPLRSMLPPPTAPLLTIDSHDAAALRDPAPR